MPSIGAPIDHTDIPDLLEPIVGIRGWHLGRRGKAEQSLSRGPYTAGLQSLSRAYSWDRDERATCPWNEYLHPDNQAANKEQQLIQFPPHAQERRRQLLSNPLHQPPYGPCGCGLYAFHSARLLKRAYRDAAIAGVVQAWGTCEIHEEGFRSEYMRICAIAPTPYTRSILKRKGPAFQQRCDQWFHTLAEQYQVPLVQYSELESRMDDWGKRADNL